VVERYRERQIEEKINTFSDRVSIKLIVNNEREEEKK
jgi:hypothetical protein